LGLRYEIVSSCGMGYEADSPCFRRGEKTRALNEGETHKRRSQYICQASKARRIMEGVDRNAWVLQNWRQIGKRVGFY